MSISNIFALPVEAAETTFTITQIIYNDETKNVPNNLREQLSFSQVFVEGGQITMIYDYVWDGEQNFKDVEGVEWKISVEKEESMEWIGILSGGSVSGDISGASRTIVRAASQGSEYTGVLEGTIKGNWKGDFTSEGSGSGTFSYTGEVSNVQGFLGPLAIIQGELASALKVTAGGTWSNQPKSGFNPLPILAAAGVGSAALGVLLRRRRKPPEAPPVTVPILRERQIEREEEKERRDKQYSISLTPTMTWADGEVKTFTLQLYSRGVPSNDDFSIQISVDNRFGKFMNGELSNDGTITKFTKVNTPLEVRFKPYLSMDDLDIKINVTGEVYRRFQVKGIPIKEDKKLVLKGCDLLLRILKAKEPYDNILMPSLIHPGNKFMFAVRGELIKRDSGKYIDGRNISSSDRLRIVFSNDQKIEVYARRVDEKGSLVFNEDKKYYVFSYLEHVKNGGSKQGLKAKDGVLYVKGEVELAQFKNQKKYSTEWKEIEVMESIDIELDLPEETYEIELTHGEGDPSTSWDDKGDGGYTYSVDAVIRMDSPLMEKVDGRLRVKIPLEKWGKTIKITGKRKEVLYLPRDGGNIQKRDNFWPTDEFFLKFYALFQDEEGKYYDDKGEEVTLQKYIEKIKLQPEVPRLNKILIVFDWNLSVKEYYLDGEKFEM